MTRTNASSVRTGTRAGDEPLPFIISLQDVFLTLGVVIFLAGAALTLPLLLGGLTVPEGSGARGLAASFGLQGALMLALIAWLSHVLVGVRRRTLPGIVLSMGFVASAVGLYVAWATALVPGGLFTPERWVDLLDLGAKLPDGPMTDADLRAAASKAVAAVPLTARLLFVGLPIIGLLAALAYYRAYALPFATALVALAATAFVWCVLLLSVPYDTIRLDPSLTLAFGLALLAAAITYDARDPERTMRWSNNGFWLHLVAAPTVLSGAIDVATYGVAMDLTGLANGEAPADPFGVRRAVVTLVVIAVLALVALLLNRRALVVAGLTAAGVAIGRLLIETGADGAVVAAATLVILGGGVLLLGIGWHAARAGLLAPLPTNGPLGRVFPPVRDEEAG